MKRFDIGDLEYTVLTDREKEILELMAHGYSNQQIMEILNIKWCTLGTHQRNIYSKFYCNEEEKHNARCKGAIKIRAILYYLKYKGIIAKDWYIV